jgi:uncharacterized protein (TIGR00730 family)
MRRNIQGFCQLKQVNLHELPFTARQNLPKKASMEKYINKVVVFCGSSPGNDPEIVNQTELLGELLARRSYELIYGGGDDGLMGVLSKAVLKAGGRVKAYIPEIFRKSAGRLKAGSGRIEEHIVEDMLTRKDKMILDADAGIALPGGFGSLDEIFEMAVTQQIKSYVAPDQFVQPLIVINYNGYYDGQKASIEKMVEKGMLRKDHAKFIIFASDVNEAIDFLDKLNKQPPQKASKFKGFELS